MESKFVEVGNPFSNPTGGLEKYGELYPEVVAAGRLSGAVAQILARLGYSLVPRNEGPSPFWANFIEGRRSVAVQASAAERRFLSQFWSKGAELARLDAADLGDVARATKLWLDNKLALREMEQEVVGIKITDMAYEFEAGRGVDAQWKMLLSSTSAAESLGPLLELVRAANNKPLLRQLFPFQSMATLRFSRTTGFPYTSDLPFAVVTGQGDWYEVAKNPHYRAFKSDGTLLGQGTPETFLGEGTPEEVMELVARALPLGVGPAVDGTAEELKG